MLKNQNQNKWNKQPKMISRLTKINQDLIKHNKNFLNLMKPLKKFNQTNNRRFSRQPRSIW